MGRHVSLVGFGALLGACTATHFERTDSLGDGNSAGQGDGTLYIEASVTAKPVVMNTTDASLFDVSFRVFAKSTVGGDWSGAVTISSNSGEVPLAFDGATWVGTVSGYEQVYQLDIDSDVGYVHGVRLEGPDIHRITTPSIGGTLHGSNDSVAWERGIAASEVTLTSATGDYVYIPVDVGVTVDNGLAIGVDPNNTLTVTRTNRIEPAGAGGFNGASSQFSVNVSNSVDVLLVP